MLGWSFVLPRTLFGFLNQFEFQSRMIRKAII